MPHRWRPAIVGPGGTGRCLPGGTGRWTAWGRRRGIANPGLARSRRSVNRLLCRDRSVAGPVRVERGRCPGTRRGGCIGRARNIRSTTTNANTIQATANK